MRVLNWHAITISLILVALPVTRSEAATSAVSAAGEIGGLHELSGIAGMLNEVEERRRRVVYTSYPGLATQGVVHKFVHTTDGSSAFSRIDLVLPSDMPITIRRAYNSMRTSDKNFGTGGWRLTVAEEIHPEITTGMYRYIYGNSQGVEFSGAGVLTSSIDQVTTDISDIGLAGSDQIRITLRTGIIKEFIRRGNIFVLNRVSDAFGNSHRFEYDHSGLVAIVANDRDRVDLHRDSEGNVMSIRGSNGRVVEYSYLGGRLLDSVTDVRGESWGYGYDPNSYLSNATTPMGTVNLRFQHDANGRVVESSINATNHHFRYENNETKVTDGSGREIRFQHYDSGITSKIINWVGIITAVGTNRYGQPERLMRNDEIVSRIQYQTLAHRAIPMTQMIRQVKSGERVILKFDEQGRVSSQRSRRLGESYQVGGYEYGTTPSSVLLGDKTNIKFQADARGNPKHVQIRSGAELDFMWSDTQTKVSVGGQRAILYFDDLRQLRELSAPRQKNVDYTYGQGGFRESMTVSDGSEIDYQYSPAGTLIYTETTQADGTKATFAYDVGPDETLRRISGSGVDGRHVFGYTPSGRLNNIESTVMNSFTFLYDDLDRLEVAIPNGFEPLTYTYAEGEVDIVAQQDARTRAVYSQEWDVHEYASRFDKLYTRTVASQIGVLTYDEQLGEIVPAIRPGEWLPSHKFVAAINNTKLLSLFDRDGPDIFSFSMPSNRLFVPAEYWTVNCCFCCPIEEVICEIP